MSDNTRCEIVGLHNIQEYCKHNDIKTLYKNSPTSISFVSKKLVYNDKGNLIFTKYVGFIALDAKDLRIGDKERLTKTPIAPSNDDELMGAASDDIPF